jgi:hypothetical protein
LPGRRFIQAHMLGAADDPKLRELAKGLVPPERQ